MISIVLDATLLSLGASVNDLRRESFQVVSDLGKSSNRFLGDGTGVLEWGSTTSFFVTKFLGIMCRRDERRLVEQHSKVQLSGIGDVVVTRYMNAQGKN